MARRTIDLTAPPDLVSVVGLHFRGRGDPTGRVSTRSLVRATRAPDGPATLLAELRGTSVNDFHLRNLVAFALAGEPRATDQRMLELLEPWRGHRARVVRLLELSGISAPRYGPRYAPPDRREM